MGHDENDELGQKVKVVADDGEAEREYNCVMEEAEEDDGDGQVLEVNQEGKCYETWERHVEVVEGVEEEQEEKENDEWK